MKKIIGIIILLFSINALIAQELPLIIEDLEVKYKGEVINAPEPIERTIVEDQKSDVLIYEKDGYKYYSTFEYFRSVNRVKMTVKNYILMPDGKKKYGKVKKYVQFIKVGIPGEFNKTMSEQILIDKKTFLGMTASYKYTIKYAYN